MSFTISGKALIIVAIIVAASLGGALGGYTYGQMATKLEYQNTITTLTQEKEEANNRINELTIINDVASSNNTILKQTITNLMQQNARALSNHNNSRLLTIFRYSTTE